MFRCAIFVFLVSLCSAVSAHDQAPAQDVPIQIRLKPDKNTIMLGEPLFISFEVTNLSGEKLCLGVGGDYRNRFGRPNNFEVTVRNANGSELPQFEVFNLGGLIGCEPIDSGATYTVRLFLAHWAAIEQTGAYRINVKNRMGFHRDDSPGNERPGYAMSADVNAEFVVVPYDENKMGAVINTLGSIMLDSSDPRAEESAQALESLHDIRAITYFAEALRKLRDIKFDFYPTNGDSIRARSIVALGAFDDDVAIEALKAAMNSPIAETRRQVAAALADSPRKSKKLPQP